MIKEMYSNILCNVNVLNSNIYIELKKPVIK